MRRRNIRFDSQCDFEDPGASYTSVHGNASGWDISEGSDNFTADEVNKFIGALSLPVVFSIACETGQFKPAVPVGPYNDGYNQGIWYWQFDHDTISKSMSCTQQPDKNQPLKKFAYSNRPTWPL
jgi:hypothetical protein